MDKMNIFLATRYEWLVDPNPATWDAYQNAMNAFGDRVVKLAQVDPQDMEGLPVDEGWDMVVLVFTSSK
jgi:hypothetical protein